MKRRRFPSRHAVAGSGRRSVCAVWLFAAIGLAAVMSGAWAARVRVTLPNGDRYTGEWLGSDTSQYRIQLDDGQELQLFLPKGGVVEFLTEDAAAVPYEATQRVKAAGDALDLGMEDLAETALRDAIEIAPKYARAHFELARLLERKESSEAFRHYVLAAQLDPAAYPIADKIQKAAAKAIAEQDSLGAARALFTFAQTFPEDGYAPQAAYDAANYFRKSLELPEAGPTLLDRTIQAYEYATQNFPNDPAAPEGLFYLGTLYERAKRPGEAIAMLSRLLEQYPDSPYAPRAHLTLGYAYLQQGDTAQVSRESRWVLDNSSDPDMRNRALDLASEVAWTVFTAKEGLPDDDALAVYRDGQTLWVGTTKGLASLDLSSPQGTPTVAVSNIVRPTIVRSIAADENTLWIGTSGIGLVRYDKQTGTTTEYTRLDGLPSNRIDAIALDDAAVWIGGLGGVARLDRATRTLQPYLAGEEFPGRDVTCMVLTPFSVWVGTKEDGIHRFDRATKTWESFSTADGLGSDAIRSLALTDTGLLAAWYTQKEKGYSEWDGAARTWRNASFGPDEIAPDNIALSVQDGTLWVATGEALLVRRPDGVWRSINYPLALESARVHTIFPDGNVIWIGTSAGLGRLDAAMLQSVGG